VYTSFEFCDAATACPLKKFKPQRTQRPQRAFLAAILKSGVTMFPCPAHVVCCLQLTGGTQVGACDLLETKTGTVLEDSSALPGKKDSEG
jgi:hypothetical protein